MKEYISVYLILMMLVLLTVSGCNVENPVVTDPPTDPPVITDPPTDPVAALPLEPWPEWRIRCEFPESVAAEDDDFQIRLYYGTYASVPPDERHHYYDRTIELFIEYYDEGITQQYLLTSLTRDELEQGDYSIDQYTINPDAEAFHHYDDYVLPIDVVCPDESGQITIAIQEYLFRGQVNEALKEGFSKNIKYEKKNGMIYLEAMK